MPNQTPSRQRPRATVAPATTFASHRARFSAARAGSNDRHKTDKTTGRTKFDGTNKAHDFSTDPGAQVTDGDVVTLYAPRTATRMLIGRDTVKLTVPVDLIRAQVPKPHPKPLCSPAEIAGEQRISVRTVYSWVRHGLESYSDGETILVDRDSVKAWIAQNLVRSPDGRPRYARRTRPQAHVRHVTDPHMTETYHDKH